MVSATSTVRSDAHRKAPPATVARKNYQRRDIQGLRALAVVAVILDHLVHWPAGGFVGVDVFFVISGFMITGQLLREYEKNGRVSLTNFYRRRVRRLLPASVLVLVCTVVASSFLFSYTRFARTSGDAIAALFFSGNWRMATQGTDYFASSAPPSPLQHFWSLGVEEQFYLVWPTLMIAVLIAAGALAKGNTRQIRIGVGLVIAGLILASYWWAVVDTTANPSWAYFSTFARAWELGVGALIAVTAGLSKRIPEVARPILAWVGIGGILVSVFVISPDFPFPGPWATLPVLASALVIIANEGGLQRWLAPFTNPVAVYIGDLSYSLYLWHFPTIIFAAVFIDVTSVSSQLTMAGAVLLLAAYSYHLLEDPVRRSMWLEPRPRRNRSKTSHSRRQSRHRSPRVDGRPVFTRRYQLVATSLVAFVAIGSVAAALHSTGADVAVEEPIVTVPSDSPSGRISPPEGMPALAQLQGQIDTARRAPTWPENLTPSIDEAIAGEQAPDDVGRCGSIQPISVPDCTWGPADAKKTAVIVGDSIAATYVGVLREAMIHDKAWKLRSYATFGCTFTAVDVKTTNDYTDKGCPAKKEEAVRGIRDLKPDVVFVANTAQPRPGHSTGALARSTQDIVDTFRSSTKQVVLLSAPPADVNIQECFSRVSKPRQCISRVTPQWLSVADADREIASAVKGRWVDSRPLFCVEGACPSFVDRTPVKLDQVHMTPEYGKKIGPAMAELLAKDKILR